jgi:hypothetical protein
MICDDVRREDNGKEIIIGVYSGSIIAETFPIFLPTFAIRFVIKVPISQPLTLEGSVVGPNGVDIVKFQGDLKTVKISPLVLPAPGMHYVKAGIKSKPKPVYSFNAVIREQLVAPKSIV